MWVSSMASGPIQLSVTRYPALCSFQRTESSGKPPLLARWNPYLR